MKIRVPFVCQISVVGDFTKNFRDEIECEIPSIPASETHAVLSYPGTLAWRGVGNREQAVVDLLSHGGRLYEPLFEADPLVWRQTRPLRTDLSQDEFAALMIRFGLLDAEQMAKARKKLPNPKKVDYTDREWATRKVTDFVGRLVDIGGRMHIALAEPPVLEVVRDRQSGEVTIAIADAEAVKDFASAFSLTEANLAGAEAARRNEGRAVALPRFEIRDPAAVDADVADRALASSAREACSLGGILLPKLPLGAMVAWDSLRSVVQQRGQANPAHLAQTLREFGEALPGAGEAATLRDRIADHLALRSERLARTGRYDADADLELLASL